MKQNKENSLITSKSKMSLIQGIVSMEKFLVLLKGHDLKAALPNQQNCFSALSCKRPWFVKEKCKHIKVIVKVCIAFLNNEEFA